MASNRSSTDDESQGRESIFLGKTHQCTIFTIVSDSNDNMLKDASLVSINGQTLASGTADFDPKEPNQLAESSKTKLHLQSEQADELISRIMEKGDQWTWSVQSVTSSRRKQNPPLPFITSSLQQEANRRIGLSVSGTMRSAQ